MSEKNGKPPQRGLKELVKSYLDDLGRSEQELSSASDISLARLRELLRDGTNRNLTRQDMSRLAYGIVFLHDQGGRGIEVLEEVLSNLLEAAGYGAMIANGQDWVFDKLALPSLHKQHKKLRVGYASWAPYIKATPRGVEGIFASWTQRIATIAGFEVELVQLHWSELVPSLHTREVDLIAPIMKVPARTFELLFSTSLPGGEIRVCGVVCNRSSSAFCLESDERYALNFVEGEVGEIVGRVVFSRAVVDDEQRPHLTVDSAVDFIRANPRTVDNRTRCLVVDQATAETICNCFGDMSVVLGAPVQFSVAFAADPREKRLVGLIDESIETLKEIGYYPEQ